MSMDLFIGWCVLSFLAGSLLTMILFCALDAHLDRVRGGRR
jgi:hypothetical protein